MRCVHEVVSARIEPVPNLHPGLKVIQGVTATPEGEDVDLHAGAS